MPKFVPSGTVSQSSRGVFVPFGGPAPKTKPKKHGGGGLLGTLGRIPGAAAKDVYHAAVGAPAGLYYTGEALTKDVAELYGPTAGARHERAFGRTRRIGKQVAKGFEEDIRHPLRRPGYTALDILGVASLGAGTAARGAAALGKVGEGARAAEVARAAALGPKPGTRVLRVGELEVKHPASRSALTRAAERLRDKRAQAALNKKPGGVRAARAQTRASKWLNEEVRAEEAAAKAPAAALAAAGKKLNKEQQWALRLVAEEAPVKGRLAATAKRIAETKGSERRRHVKRYKLTAAAEKHLAPGGGKPKLAEGDRELRAVYDRMVKVTGSREELGKQLGLLTEGMIQGRKTAAGRVALGAEYEKPTPGKLGISQPLERARKRVAKLEARYETQLAKSAKRAGEPERVRIPGTAKTRPRTAEQVQARIGELEKALEPKITAVYKYIRSAKPSEARGRNRQARREATQYEKERGPTYQVGGGDIVKRDIKPTTPRTGEQAKDRDWQRAEEEIYQRGKREGAHPTLKKLADQMDELDQLKALVLENKMAPIEGKAAAGFGTIAGKGAKARYEPSAIPPRGKYGPSVERLGGALSVARDELARIEATVAKRQKRTGIIGQEQFKASPEAVYIPDIELSPRRGGGRITGVGEQGTIGQTKSPFRYGYTGGGKRTAREPLKTTRAVAESQLAVARYSRIVKLKEKLKKAASPEPRRESDVAIRLDNLPSSRKLPAEVRQFLDDPQSLAPEEQAHAFDRLRRDVLLAPENAEEFNRLHAEGMVGWVPKRLLGDLGRSQAPLRATAGKLPTEVVDTVNNAQRTAILYLKPAYAIPNLLGNAALNIVQQGFAAPKHLRRAVTAQWTWGPERTAQIDTLMHEGFAAALRGETGHLARGTQWMANVWGAGVDKPFRRASFSYEAGRSGFKSAAQIDRLLNDPVLHDELMNIVKRANREIIDYGRLSHREREIIRRVIFFYPWVKGSTMYAGNFLLEHPAKAMVAGQLGQQGREETVRRLGFAPPSFLEGTAVTPGGRLMNMQSAAILQTPAQVGGALAALGTGYTPEAAESNEFLSPVFQLGANLLAGKNLRTGREYPRSARGIPQIAEDTLLRSLPQYRLYQQIMGDSRSKLFPPSPRAGLMQYLVGGIYPREFNEARLRELARREQKELRR